MYVKYTNSQKRAARSWKERQLLWFLPYNKKNLRWTFLEIRRLAGGNINQFSLHFFLLLHLIILTAVSN
jgi:hypothetical protein